MKNKIICAILMFTLVLSFSVTSFAEGDGNIDGGGGGMGTGTSQNFWSGGNDGVRVTIINTTTGSIVGIPIDYTNKSHDSGIIYFGKKSKLHYINGSPLALSVGGVYGYKNPPISMPKIIGTNGTSNIAAIKSYFCSDGAARMIANDFGISFEALTSGSYKLFLEPIVYLTFKGNQIGMTAHEAALYDQQLGGGIRSKFVDLSHKNLPLAMFLERPDLGFPAFSGNSSARQDNSTILSSLGMGIVSYTETPQIPPEPEQTDVEYRINTEVITAVTLHTFDEINPDSPATVTFNVGGRIYTMSNIVIPEGDSQLVWCKWTTPATEQNVTITVRTNKGYLSEDTIYAKIVDLDKNPPPDPKATDRNDSFRTPTLPNNPQKTSARWSVWWASWHPNWVWIPVLEWCSHSSWTSDGNGGGSWSSWGHWVDNGYYEDQGWYDFFTDNYSASITAASAITPDSKVPTASGNNMKSGYGVNNKVNATFSSSAPSSHVTSAQTAISYFPEFQYNTYWRLLDLTVRGYSSQLEFKQNKYSTYNQRVHFTPVWYPDGNYKVYTYLIDAWTPAGMLSVNLNGSVTIQKSVFDDWHIAPK